jgi:uncharacterized protein (DUF58 family)
MSSRQSLFDEAFLRRLEHLNLLTRQPVAGHLRGSHRARRTGSGMVFADFRPYSPGDDIKNLDWAIYLRLDRLIVRLFEEEADLPVYVFLDASASMGFGAPAKLDFACRVAAALGYLALVNHDRVHVVAWADGIVRELPVRRGRAQVWSLFRFLQSLEAAGGTSLEAALKGWFGARRTRGLVVLLSDFMDPEGFAPAANWLRRFRHDVFALQVLSQDETEPRLPEEVVLVDAESGASDTMHVTPSLVSAYRDALDEHCRDIEAVCRSCGWTYLRARSDAPFEALMLQVLREEGVLR